MVGAAEQGRKRHGRRIRHNFYRNERKRPRERLGRERLRGSDPARGAAARRQASRGASRPTGREVRVGDAGKDEASSFYAPFGNPWQPRPNSADARGLRELWRGHDGPVAEISAGPSRRTRRGVGSRRVAEAGPTRDHRAAAHPRDLIEQSGQRRILRIIFSNAGAEHR